MKVRQVIPKIFASNFDQFQANGKIKFVLSLNTFRIVVSLQEHIVISGSLQSVEITETTHLTRSSHCYLRWCDLKNLS